MPILVDDLSVWDISFRWAGYDPRKWYFRIPLEVENNFRNLLDAILKGELACETITLEKRHFEPDEKELSIYHWIDDIYGCIGGHYNNRKLLRWAQVGRFDFKLWCERINIPLPEFWFPQGWNLEYELPEYELGPGYGYELKYWTTEERAEYKKMVEANRTSKLEHENIAADKIRPNQEARIACRQIAKQIWQKEPTRTIASVIKDSLIQEYGGAAPFMEDTVREWIKDVAPPEVRNRRGRPRKNGDKDK